MHTYLVGNQLSPDNLGAGVEGELHCEWGKLQLLDGVGLQRFNVCGSSPTDATLPKKLHRVVPDAEHHWWVHQQEHGSGQ